MTDLESHKQQLIQVMAQQQQLSEKRKELEAIVATLEHVEKKAAAEKPAEEE